LFHAHGTVTTPDLLASACATFFCRVNTRILREQKGSAEHFNYTKLWRFVMRLFFIAVGILSWLLALSVLWIFAESGGALTVIAAGVFAGVAIVSLGVERVLKLLEEIRDRNVPDTKVSVPPAGKVERVEIREREVVNPAPTGALPV
jgi:hypothetical protein